MTSFQMQHLKTITESEQIPLRYLMHYRGRNRHRVFEAIQKLYNYLVKEGKINQKKIAKRLGKNPAQINRWLSSPSNLTLDSISDLLLAMNAEIENFKTILLEDRAVLAEIQADELRPLYSLTGFVTGEIYTSDTLRVSEPTFHWINPTNLVEDTVNRPANDSGGEAYLTFQEPETAIS